MGANLSFVFKLSIISYFLSKLERLIFGDSGEKIYKSTKITPIFSHNQITKKVNFFFLICFHLFSILSEIIPTRLLRNEEMASLG